MPAGFDECPEGKGKGGAPCGEAAHACVPGTVAFFGQARCTAVGPGECPSGFTRDASGFGCMPVFAKTTCTGASRPRLGERSCVPVGDCNAPFPPPGAAYFVDDSYTAGQLDGTHFATIQAAVAAAPSGATIAIEEGSYSGTVTLPKAVTLVGRCAAKVTLSGAGAATPGLEVMKKLKAFARGLTITDFEVGVSAGGGADVSLDGLVVQSNRRLGILGADAGTRVLAKGIVIRGTLPDASGRFGHGAASGFDGELTIEDSAITDSSEMGAGAQRDGRINIVRSVVSGVVQRTSNKAYGWGVGTQTGGQATVIESAILDTFTGGVVAAENRSAVRLERSYVGGVRRGPATNGGTFAAAALAQNEGASLDIIGSTLAGSDRYGVFVNAGARATISSTAVRDLSGSPLDGAGVQVAEKSSATVTTSAVLASTVSGLLNAGTLDATDLYVGEVTGAAVASHGTTKVVRLIVSDLQPGKGLNAELSAALYVGDGNSLEASEVIVRKAHGLGALALGSGTMLSIRRSAISDIQAPEDFSGYGLAATQGAEVTLEDAVIGKARDVGVYVSDPGTIASLRRVSVVDVQPNGPEGRARSLNVQNGALLNLVRVLAHRGKQVGLNVVGEGARAVVEDSVITGVQATEVGFGHGIAVTAGGALVMTRSVVGDHAGIGLVFANASGSVATSVIRANPVGVHTQEGVSLVEVPSAPAELIPLSAAFTTDTRFEDNGTKVGSGQVPLPVQAAPPNGR